MHSEDSIEYQIASYIYKVFTVVFLLIGTSTNIISAIVYSKKKMRKTSYSIYLFFLAIVDLCVTVNGNTRIFLMSYEINIFNKIEFTDFQKSFKTNLQIFKGVDIRETSLAMCRIHRFSTYFFLQLSSVILCLLSIDRFFGCVLVLKSSNFCKPSVARKTVLVSAFVLFFFNLHFLTFMGQEITINISNSTSNFNSTNQTIIKVINCEANQSNNFYDKLWRIYFYLDSLVYCILPFIIMFTCNILIISKIISSRIRSKKVILTKKKNSKNTIIKNSSSMLASEKRISIILVVISLSFLILTIPVFLMENLDDSYFEKPIFEIALAIAYMLMYSNHVINFFFYCALGPSFRKEVKKLFPLFMCINNKVNPLKMSRYNTVLIASSTLNPKKLNKTGSNLNVQYKNQKLVMSNFQTTKIESFVKSLDRLSVCYTPTVKFKKNRSTSVASLTGTTTSNGPALQTTV